jgi:ribosomal protein S18 acetylase RimI-like enzyme
MPGQESRMKDFRTLPGPALTGERTAPALHLVPAHAIDDAVRAEVYALTRAPEFAGVALTVAQQSALLRQQFELQERDYRHRFPVADLDMVRRKGEWIGRFYVDRSTDPIRLLDIALLPQWRGLGMGRALIDALLLEADTTNRDIVLHVSRDNPAERLYRRLGFRIDGEDGPSHRMIRQPGETDCTGFS